MSTTPINYQWRGHLVDADHTEMKVLTLGGNNVTVCAEFIEEEDGSLTIDLVSNGPQTRHDLTRLVNLLQTVVTQDAIEADRENTNA